MVGAVAPEDRPRMAMSVVVVPTAVHVRAVAQDTPSTFVTAPGKTALVQVLPPSVVDTMAPARLGPAAVSTVCCPTAQQWSVSVHEIPERVLMPAGRVWLVQVAPPSVVAATAPVAKL